MQETGGARLPELRDHHDPQQQPENGMQVDPRCLNRFGPGIVHQANDADGADKQGAKPSARMRTAAQLDRSNRGQISPPCNSLPFRTLQYKVPPKPLRPQHRIATEALPLAAAQWVAP